MDHCIATRTSKRRMLAQVVQVGLDHIFAFACESRSAIIHLDLRPILKALRRFPSNANFVEPWNHLVGRNDPTFLGLLLAL